MKRYMCGKLDTLILSHFASHFTPKTSWKQLFCLQWTLGRLWICALQICLCLFVFARAQARSCRQTPGIPTFPSRSEAVGFSRSYAEHQWPSWTYSTRPSASWTSPLRLGKYPCSDSRCIGWLIWRAEMAEGWEKLKIATGHSSPEALTDLISGMYS